MSTVKLGREVFVYEFIRGHIEYLSPEYVVIENNGIGYKIYTPNPFLFSKDKEKMIIYTYQHVREDLIALYGFKTREERALFMKLINVSGIGPKGALAILASGQPKHVIGAIESEDEKYLLKFPGVGKKTARQMILDLKGKLTDIIPNLAPDLFHAEDPSETLVSSHSLQEALEALKALGYSEKEINKITPHLKEETCTTDQYLKKALQLLLK